MEWGVPILLGVIICAFFILTSYLLQIAGLSLDRAGILLGYLVTSFSLAFVFYAFYKRTEIRRWFQRTKYLNTGEGFEIKEEEFEGVMIPVSRREQPEWIIRHLKPKFRVCHKMGGKVSAHSVVIDRNNKLDTLPLLFSPIQQTSLDVRHIQDILLAPSNDHLLPIFFILNTT